MANFENETASSEEKLQIAQHFLLSSPPGQFLEVNTDVQKLLPDGLLTDSLLAGIGRVYNVRNGRVVTAPSGEKTVLHEAGEVDQTHYIDPSTNKVFQVDHVKLSTLEDSDAPSLMQDTEKTRSALQRSLKDYIEKTYMSEASACAAFFKDEKFTLVITGEKVNLRNFWSGKWNSVWTLQTTDEEYKLEGTIKILAHYFEDGNLQLNSKKDIPLSEGTYESDDDLCSKVLAVIRSEENKVQNGYEEMYSNMSEQTIKSLRRVMPITRTKMEWNINSVRMNKQVRK